MKHHTPYKYRLHLLLTNIGVERGEETKKEVIGKILIQTQMSIGKFKNYRYAKVGDEGTANTVSISDMRTIVNILDSYLSDNDSIELKDMYHEDIIEEELLSIIE